MNVVLLIDDSENDRFLIRRALAIAKGEFECHEVDSVAKAMLYLTRAEPFKHESVAPMPDLVLCDLGMPSEDGFSFMDWLRLQPDLHHIKVAFITGACPPGIHDLALAKQACAFIDKNHAVNHPDRFLRDIRNCLAPANSD